MTTAENTANYCVALCTCDDSDTATRLARLLVQQRLAACVNLIHGIQSVYEWEGSLETAGEILLVIKTSRSRLPALKACITEQHPYDVPELITLAITDGLPDYLSWLGNHLGN